MNKAIDSRLAKLEAKRHAPVTICCVAIGDGPPMRADGSTCTAHHAKVFVLGGWANEGNDAAGSPLLSAT